MSTPSSGSLGRTLVVWLDEKLDTDRFAGSLQQIASLHLGAGPTGRQDTVVPAEVADRLFQAGREEGASPPAIVQTALVALLLRHGVMAEGVELDDQSAAAEMSFRDLLRHLSGRLAGEGSTLHPTGAPAALTLVVSGQDEIRLTALYRSDLLDGARAGQMLDRLPLLIRQLAAAMDRPIHEISLLTPTERRRILTEWSQERVDFGPAETVHHRFERQVTETPEHVAVRLEGQSLTYRQLNRLANRLASRLMQAGVGPGRLVGIYTDRSIEMVAALLAVLKAGGAYVPLDPEYPRERLAYMVTDAGLTHVLTQRALVNLLPEQVETVISVDDPEPPAGPEWDVNPEAAVTTESTAYVIYTSGSTGKPKGALITHGSLWNHAQWMRHHFGITEADRFLQHTTFSFDASVCELFTPLLCGAGIVLAAPGGHRDPAYLRDLIVTEGVTTALFVPSLLQIFLEQPGLEACSSLRRVLAGGEVLPPALQERFFARMGAQLFNTYGPTETTIDAASYRCVPGQPQRSVPIGRPIANGELYILDRNLEPVPPGIPGELYVGGAGVGPGYLNRPELTAERFIAHPFSDLPGARLYRTGDLARWLPDGNVEFIGRVDHQVKVRGFRIELGEIETALGQHPSVRETAVVAREDHGGDRQLVAFYVPLAGQNPSSAELGAFLMGILAEYMVPSAFVPLEQLPLTPSGKVDRRALAAYDPGETEDDMDHTPPRTATEEALAAIWSDVLGMKRIGIHANFFRIGGHSLKVMQMVGRIRERLDVQVPVRAVYERPTIAELAAFMEEAEGTEEEMPFPPIERVDRSGYLPLSPTQERIWFLQKLYPENAAYAFQDTMTFTGPLSPEVLRQTLQEIVNRHEIMRTTFPEVDDHPVQVIHPSMTVELPLIDLSSLPPQEREEEAQRLIKEAVRAPFDLSKLPLIRWKLLRMGEEEHILIHSEHHFLHDGWSFNIFLSELKTLYRTFLEGKESPLPEPTIQFADFAVWQQALMKTEIMDRQRAFWRQKLSGDPPVITLPTDRPRPSVMSFRGNTLSLELPGHLARALRKVSREAGVTLFATLSAAFKLLLHRYTGHTDIVLGSSMANRRLRESESVIGMIVNTVALRTDLSDMPLFTELQRRVQQALIEAHSHQDLPFSEVVQAVGAHRDLSQNPIVQISFNFHDSAMPALTFTPDLKGRLHEGVSNGTAKFDLNVIAIPRVEQRVGTGSDPESEGVLMNWEYNADLFDATSIERLYAHYCTLLEGIVQNPRAPIAELPMLTEAERQQILVEWNRTEQPFPEQVCLHQLVEAQVERTPDAVAVVFEGAQLTYRELNQRANQLAHYLRKQGVGPDVLVGIAMERSLEMVVGVLGILKAGGAYVPMDSNLPRERLAYMLADAAVPLLLTQQHDLDRLAEHGASVICLDSDWGRIAAESDTNPESGVTADNLAYTIYTSGSTGKPKGAMNRHSGICNQILWMQSAFRLNGTDRVLQKTPISSDASVWELFLPLTTGARLVVAKPEGHKDLAYLVDLIRREGITTIQFVPALLQVFLSETDLAECRSLRHVFCGGEALPYELQERFLERMKAELHNLYGPTETAVQATYWTCRHDDQRRTVPIGRPVANTQIYLLDGSMNPVPVGVPGELYVGGAQVGAGYLNRPELTAERFVRDPFSKKPGAKLYRTGDLARYLPDGTIEYLGRADHQVKVRGYRIEPGEIEHALSGHPQVREAVVTAHKDRWGDQRLVAYIICESDQVLTGAELQDFLKQELPEYMIPAAFMVLTELPRTSNGKVDRKGLPAPDFDQPDIAEAYLPAVTPTQRELVEIWQEVLGLSRVGIRDNFFALGGHSLLATRVIARVRRRYQVEVSLQQLFAAPTIEEMAETVDAGRKGGLSGEEPIVRVDRKGELPLSSSQRRLWFLDQMTPGTATYNIPFLLHLLGPLDTAALEWAFTEIVRRHEVLRTVFPAIQGRPVQVITEPKPFPLPLADITRLPVSKREAEGVRLAQEEATRPFSLEQGPLLRAMLIRMDAQEHLLIINVHHIAFDGWSVGLLSRELSALYDARVKGEASPLPEPEVQFADYAAWQEQWLQKGVLDQQLGYWKQQLGGRLPLLDLPTDRPRPPVQTFRGDSRSVRLPRELVERLRALGQAEGSSLFQTLLAGFSVLLFRYTSQEDILIGTPVANRNRLDTEGLIGFLTNTLVLRSRLSPENPFRTVLEQVRRVVLEAHAHQDLPFEKLVEVLQPDRSLTHSPLFQVSFTYHSSQMESTRLTGLEVTELDLETGTAKFDLSLGATEEGDELRLSMAYNSDLFYPETIDRMLGHYRQLLEGAVAGPDLPIYSLPLMAEEERQVMVKPAAADSTLVELFEQQVARTPEAVAATYEGQSLTYDELNRRANQVAHRLRRLGVGPEVLVGLCLERSLELMVGLVGILKAGGAYVPLDPSLPPDRMRFMLEDSRVPVLVTQQPMLSESLAGADREVQVICLDSDAGALAQESTQNPVSGVTAENLAYVIYTSGSTGRPKGTMVTHRNVVRLFRSTEAWFRFDRADVWTLFHSYAFDFSVWEIWGALLYGGRLVVVPFWTSRSPGEFYNLISRERVTVLNQTPSAFRQLIRAEEEAASGLPLALRLVIFGGEALELRSLKPWFDRHGESMPQLVNMYGITETTVHVTYRPIRLKDVEEAPGSMIGAPIPDLQLYVLDQQMQPVPVGVRGELYVGGAGVARGYLNRPELTEARFIPDPFNPGGRLYRSGDLARRLPDGDLEYLGRIDHQVKIRGFRVELGEIESVLAEHPSVREAVVVTHESPSIGTELVAYVVPTGTGPLEMAELRSFLKGRLPDYMVPAKYVHMDALPLTSNGKVDRKALPAPNEPASTDPMAEAAFAQQVPLTPTEELVAAIFAEVLGLDHVGLNDHFFELGGHSLLVTQAIARVRETFQAEIPLRAFFEEPTVAGVSRKIGAAMPVGEGVPLSPVPQAERVGELPLSFAQQRLWFTDQYEPGNSVYNIPVLYRLAGRLNVAALEEAFSEIIRRHESLRTVFRTHGQEPHQVILPPSPIHLNLTDLRQVPAADREAEAFRLATEEAIRPFDLAQGPLLRISLLRSGPEEHFLLIIMHHIISDGVSIGIMASELSAIYRGLIADGRLPALPELPVQYADYAKWERERMQGEVLELRLGYWRKRLQGLQALELPPDRPRPPVQTHRGDECNLVLSRELTESLRALGREEGATLFMALMATLDALLYLQTGQSDVSVGTTVANRGLPEVEGLIGFFVNNLVLRTDLSGNPSFREVLRRARVGALEAYTHQDLPFDMLVDALQVRRDPSRTPLFQVMVSQVVQEGQLGMEGLKVETVSFFKGLSHFDLVFYFNESPNGVAIDLVYNVDLYEPRTITDLLDQFKGLVEVVTQDPDRRLQTLLKEHLGNSSTDELDELFSG